jgi:putative intracellular protease/amidase
MTKINPTNTSSSVRKKSFSVKHQSLYTLNTLFVVSYMFLALTSFTSSNTVSASTNITLMANTPDGASSALSSNEEILEPSKKILIVGTSSGILGDAGYPTGVWLPEMTHPYYALKNSGFEIDIATPTGGNIPVDPYSIPSYIYSTNRDDPMTEKFLRTPEDVTKINNTLQLSGINSSDYSAVVFPGGNGATYDFPWDENVNHIASEIYEQGGIVAAVCHGPAALLNASLADGTPLVKGMNVTGFSNEEEAITEILIGAKNVIPFFLEDEFPSRGATFVKEYVHEPNVVVSGEGGRLITGQNPESAFNVGMKVVEMLSR